MKGHNFSTKRHFFPTKFNRPFCYSEDECGSNDISLQFVEFSNVYNCDRSFKATLSSFAYNLDKNIT